MTPPAAHLRVAAAQAPSQPGDLPGNAAIAASLAARAGADGARVVVLPELFLPGYHPPVLAAEPSTDVVADGQGRVDDARLDPLRRSACDASIVVVVGAAVRDADGCRHLSSLVVTPDGAVVEAYRKQYLCGSEERDLFAPGTVGTALELDGWVLALGICYDGSFPEHARTAARDGALAYLCSSAFVLGGEHRRDVYYRARAVENGLFVVLADAVGGTAPFRFGGGSCVLDPQGRPLAQASAGERDVVVADLELDLLTRTRAEHTMLSDSQVVAAPSGPARRLPVG